LSGRRIRPIAVAVVRRGSELLVHEGRDDVKGESFLRLPGGEIDFGETASGALRRELREELAAEIDEPELLGVLEDVFTYGGAPGHEIAFVFDARFAEATLYERDRWEWLEITPVDAVGEQPVRWLPLAAMGEGGLPLYPTGSLALLD
jgi:ADP-ribose pyrophosphatase YjhB (NUDIX family)